MLFSNLKSKRKKVLSAKVCPNTDPSLGAKTPTGPLVRCAYCDTTIENPFYKSDVNPFKALLDWKAGCTHKSAETCNWLKMCSTPLTEIFFTVTLNILNDWYAKKNEQRKKSEANTE